MKNEKKILDAEGIMQLLPHRHPFLLIDKIIDYELGKWITAIKDVSIDEPYFEGHFPNKPIVPGVLIVESMAQAGGVLGHLTVGDTHPKLIYYLVGVEKARFRCPVIPGDRLVINVNVDRILKGTWCYSSKVSVGATVVAEAQFMCSQSTDNK